MSKIDHDLEYPDVAALRLKELTDDLACPSMSEEEAYSIELKRIVK